MICISDLVLDGLLLTHKSYSLMSTANKLVFYSKMCVTKFAVFALFDLIDVKVKKISSMNYKPEVIGFRNRKGKSKAYKKFIITFDSSENASAILEKIISFGEVVKKEVSQ
jgi:ribosomal protein L23